jgi:hypothetical protein
MITHNHSFEIYWPQNGIFEVYSNLVIENGQLVDESQLTDGNTNKKYAFNLYSIDKVYINCHAYELESLYRLYNQITQQAWDDANLYLNSLTSP